MRGRRPGKALRWLIVILAITVCGFIIAEVSLTPALLAMAEYEARITGVEAIYRAIERQIGGNIAYTDLMKIGCTADGRVSYVQADYARIDTLVVQAVGAVQMELASMEGRRLAIPLGQALGARFFAAYGPKLPTTVYPLGTVTVAVEDTITDAGINQIKHTIFLLVEARLKVVVPLMSKEFPVRTRIPLSSMVIVGDVPDVYWMWGQKDGLLGGLLPNGAIPMAR